METTDDDVQLQDNVENEIDEIVVQPPAKKKKGKKGTPQPSFVVSMRNQVAEVTPVVNEGTLQEYNALKEYITRKVAEDPNFTEQMAIELRTRCIKVEVRACLKIDTETRMEKEGLSSLYNPVDINDLPCDQFFRIINLVYQGTSDARVGFDGTFIEYIRRKKIFDVKLTNADSFCKYHAEYQEAAGVYRSTNHVAMTKAWWKVMKSSASVSTQQVGKHLELMFEAANERSNSSNDDEDGDNEFIPDKEDRDFSKAELEFLESIKGYAWTFNFAIRIVRRRLDALMDAYRFLKNEAPDALLAECAEEVKCSQGKGMIVPGKLSTPGKSAEPKSQIETKPGSVEPCRACGRWNHTADGCEIVVMNHPDRNMDLSVPFSESEIGKQWKSQRHSKIVLRELRIDGKPSGLPGTSVSKTGMKK